MGKELIMFLEIYLWHETLIVCKDAKLSKNSQCKQKELKIMEETNFLKL